MLKFILSASFLALVSLGATAFVSPTITNIEGGGCTGASFSQPCNNCNLVFPAYTLTPSGQAATSTAGYSAVNCVGSIDDQGAQCQATSYKPFYTGC